MKCRATVLALLVFALWSRDTCAARWPRWAAEATSRPYLDRYGGEDAVVVLDEWDLELRDGRRTGQRRWLVHVLNGDGLESAYLALPSSAFSRFSGVKIWVRKPDGRTLKYSEEEGSLFGAANQRMLDDFHVLVLTPPQLGVGDRVAVEADVSREADWPQDLFRIQSDVPTLRYVVELEGREGWAVEAELFGGEDGLEAASSGPNRWVFENVPALTLREGFFAPEPPRALFALNYGPAGSDVAFGTWSSTVDWLRNLFAPRPGAQPRVDEAHASMLSRGGNPVAEAGRLARSLRYFGIELGWGGLVPRPPETTLKRAFGDCKDKAQLMVALLERSDIEAYPVLLMAPTDGHVPEEVPSPFHFNHAGVAIPWSAEDRRPGMMLVDSPDLGTLRIFDATLSDRSAMDLSPAHEGGAALVLHPQTTGVLRLPGSDYRNAVQHVVHHWTLTGNGDARVRTEVRRKGSTRGTLEGEGGEWIRPDELRRRVQESLFAERLVVEDLVVEEIREERDGAWTFAYEYLRPRALARFDEYELLEPKELLPHWAIPLPDPGDEASAEYLPLVGTFTEIHEIAFGGRVLESRPDSFAVENDLGIVRVTIEAQEAGLRLERELRLTSRRIGPEQREQADALQTALRRANSLAFIFGGPGR